MGWSTMKGRVASAPRFYEHEGVADGRGGYSIPG
jgi:hypothetical protein